jgi:saccharopine dehydrogenase-like NADP-dependent oxidoreductase
MPRRSPASIVYFEIQLVSNNTQILVLGAGELGMAVLRNLARRAALFPGTTLTVLLRPSTITSHDPSKQRDITELHSLGVKFLAGDLVAASTTDLSDHFRHFHSVIGCTGFVAGRSIQLKLARAALGAGVKRTSPGNSASTTTSSVEAAHRTCSMSNSTCVTSCDRKTAWNG